ncbi:fumarylacetoacetase [Paraburkholderia flagellata]|uniref:fumarylacetoacetase n=1 Tax=Paraburkholderia flagellata TaxID=2883241 RepID=UPI001F201F50|nr:fumarylacetoacetase [Paraburkholderia flagellata]
MRLDHTHDAAAKSWVESANQPECAFPIQNLPFSVFRRAGTSEAFRGGVALGDYVIDLKAIAALGDLSESAAQAVLACTAPTLNAFLALGPHAWRALRHALFAWFSKGEAQAHIDELEGCLVPQANAEYALPVQIGDYTDFYTSIDHARNIVKLLRPDGSISPNFQWMPIAYHGRVSSIGLSGQPVRRPVGQRVAAGKREPELGPCARLDYELELGIFIGVGNEQGARIPVESAEAHVFGLCLLNDWSARDIQSWESAPLGPFLAKNFATTISPWIVTMDALAPFRTAWVRPEGDPQPLEYLALQETDDRAFDIQLEVAIETADARRSGRCASRVSRTSFRHQYWSIAQMVAHHTIGGCNLRPGDLLGSGTISGPTSSEAGALIELSRAGESPVELAGGETRAFLEDGDVVVMRGWCERPGFVSIGFGENCGEIIPAKWE